ncbi:virulence factor TspB C-terminal domain-related protein [Sulfurimicrobium lacus]|uniref:virulence factor TspB C-terminal domain-related protein n=1 Tax=Sulfurimicrobium lacus TaxID=2715678 RepID=UPI003CC7F815
MFSYTPEAAAFSGSCPAPLSVLGRSLSFQPACDAMSLIKPLILGLASLMAGYILIGAFRET